MQFSIVKDGFLYIKNAILCCQILIACLSKIHFLHIKNGFLFVKKCMLLSNCFLCIKKWFFGCQRMVFVYQKIHFLSAMEFCWSNNAFFACQNGIVVWQIGFLHVRRRAGGGHMVFVRQECNCCLPNMDCLSDKNWMDLCLFVKIDLSCTKNGCSAKIVLLKNRIFCPKIDFFKIKK